MICGQDRCVSPEYAQVMIQQAQDSGPGRGRCMIDTIERTEAGFAVMLSRVSVSIFFVIRDKAQRAEKGERVV